MSHNNLQGRTLLFEIFDGGVFKVIGGINTKEFTRDNPISDSTSQSTTGNETESEYVGFSTDTISGSGVVDKRSTASLIAYKTLATIANSSDPSARFRFSDELESHDGTFLITSFGKTADEQDLVNFSISLQNQGVVTYS
jgi:predicted secreted protein